MMRRHAAPAAIAVKRSRVPVLALLAASVAVVGCGDASSSRGPATATLPITTVHPSHRGATGSSPCRARSAALADADACKRALIEGCVRIVTHNSTPGPRRDDLVARCRHRRPAPTDGS